MSLSVPDVKKHIRLDHSFEDDQLARYIEWAEAEIKDSVSTSSTRNEAYFTGNTHFERAVTLLAAHFFENRLAMSDVDLNNVPYGILSAVHKLRGGYYEVE